ncbi:MAG: hypothetical protein OHK93_003864 [Ramalina farinacea]|uniref:Dipeptidyl-peptidase V n=1 Tax=Ramalina farinacea TaxID=258253 RepID=A0AA43QJX2_9LECA|nr:hypothetical protein [Ramalina farinacea]
MKRISKPFDAEDLVDLPVPTSVQVSPSGDRVLYSVATLAKESKSSIWLAETDKSDSARQITSGEHKDVLPCWCSTDEDLIAFVSNRGDQSGKGESSAIYLFNLTGGEPFPVTDVKKRAGIDSLQWSPDGRHIAYISPHEEERTPVKVYGEYLEYNIIRVLDVHSRKVQLVDTGRHVTNLAWSPDSDRIAFSSQQTPGLNSAIRNGSQFDIYSFGDPSSRRIYRFSDPTTDLVWVNNSLYFLAALRPGTSCSSQVPYVLPLNHDTDSYRVVNNESDDEIICEAQSLENFQDAESICSYGQTIMVFRHVGMRDQIIQVDDAPQSETSQKHPSQEWLEPRAIHNWQVVSAGTPTLAFVTSDCQRPPEVYCRRLHDETGLRKLSNHGSHLRAQTANFTARTITCRSTDGITTIQSLYVAPQPWNLTTKPPPTAILIHGGPYDRLINCFNTLYHYWGPYLLSRGYALLCPNLRGSAGRGDAFASAIQGRIGTVDYDDLVAVINHANACNLLDKNNLAIGGWSGGGFLTYLALAKQDFDFRAAIPGAGITDWDAFTETCDIPDFGHDVSGSLPWDADRDDTYGRRSSAVWLLKSMDHKRPKPKVLILHGESDERVPIGQGVAFFRGWRYWGGEVEMVAFPGEEHLIRGREGLVEMLGRVGGLLDGCMEK